MYIFYHSSFGSIRLDEFNLFIYLDLFYLDLFYLDLLFIYLFYLYFFFFFLGVVSENTEA